MDFGVVTFNVKLTGQSLEKKLAHLTPFQKAATRHTHRGNTNIFANSLETIFLRNISPVNATIRVGQDQGRALVEITDCDIQPFRPDPGTASDLFGILKEGMLRGAEEDSICFVIDT
jgi:hypothetical protein